MKKIKTYVLTVSRTFPVKHKRKGKETFFEQKIQSIDCETCNAGMCEYCDNRKWIDTPKIHTIRANYPLWKKRIEEIQKGNAVLSLRYWSGKPYNSKQVEFMQLDKDSGIGVQKIDFSTDYLYSVLVDEERISFSCEMIAEHDGLNNDDFKEWFKNYNLNESMAIIHFTSFRY